MTSLRGSGGRRLREALRLSRRRCRGCRSTGRPLVYEAERKGSVGVRQVPTSRALWGSGICSMRSKIDARASWASCWLGGAAA